MRVSCDQSDIGYPAFLASQPHKVVRVFLDGVEQPEVVTADEEEGFIIRAVLDDRGRVQVDPSDPESFWYETVRGKVEVKFEDAPRARN